MGDYKIIVKTSKDNNETKTCQDQLTQHQVNSHMETLTFDTETLFSVQLGPYTEKKNALTDVDKVKNSGFLHAFITNA